MTCFLVRSSGCVVGCRVTPFPGAFVFISVLLAQYVSSPLGSVLLDVRPGLCRAATGLVE